MTDSRSDTPQDLPDEYKRLVGNTYDWYMHGDCESSHDAFTDLAIKVRALALRELAALRAAKAEPVAWLHRDGCNTISAKELRGEPKWVREIWADATPLYAHPPIPEGYVMVPDKPVAIVEGVAGHLVDFHIIRWTGLVPRKGTPLYAAAPQPPGQEGEG